MCSVVMSVPFSGAPLAPVEAGVCVNRSLPIVSFVTCRWYSAPTTFNNVGSEDALATYDSSTCFHIEVSVDEALIWHFRAGDWMHGSIPGSWLASVLWRDTCYEFEKHIFASRSRCRVDVFGAFECDVCSEVNHVRTVTPIDAALGLDILVYRSQGEVAYGRQLVDSVVRDPGTGSLCPGYRCTVELLYGRAAGCRRVGRGVQFNQRTAWCADGGRISAWSTAVPWNEVLWNVLRWLVGVVAWLIEIQGDAVVYSLVVRAIRDDVVH